MGWVVSNVSKQTSLSSFWGHMIILPIFRMENNWIQEKLVASTSKANSTKRKYLRQTFIRPLEPNRRQSSTIERWLLGIRDDIDRISDRKRTAHEGEQPQDSIEFVGHFYWRLWSSKEPGDSKMVYGNTAYLCHLYIRQGTLDFTGPGASCGRNCYSLVFRFSMSAYTEYRCPASHVFWELVLLNSSIYHRGTAVRRICCECMALVQWMVVQKDSFPNIKGKSGNSKSWYDSSWRKLRSRERC